MHKRASTYRQIFTLVRPYPWLLTGIVGTATLLLATEGVGLGIMFMLLGSTERSSSLLNKLAPLLPQHVADQSIVERVQIAAVILIIIAVVRAALQSAQQVCAIHLRLRVRRELQVRVFRRFHAIPIRLLRRERSGGLGAVLIEYTNQVGHVVQDLGPVLANSIIFIAYIALTVALSWPLTLLTLGLAAVFGLVLRPALLVRTRQISLLLRDRTQEMRALIQEHLNAMSQIHLFHRHEWSQSRYEHALDAVIAQEYRASTLTGLAQPLFNLLHILVLGGIMLASTVLLQSPDVSLLTTLSLFLIIAFRLMAPIGSLTRFRVQVAQIAAMLERVLEFMEPQKTLVLPHGTKQFTTFQQNITIDKVTFKYELDGISALKNVTLTLPKGQVIAIVGSSGSGKSTLVSLIARLNDPTSGRVIVDGTDLRELEVGSWRTRLAVVSQDVFLFHASAWDNLRFARPDATDDEIYAATRLAHAHDFLRSLPQGYDTPLHEQGARLSGGQQQRLALARALLMQADLLILDEATSELDSVTEHSIHAALAQYSQGRTVLIIAHRLATIRDADQIYVLEAGELVEAGTPIELLHRKGPYYRLMQAQNGRPVLEPSI